MSKKDVNIADALLQTKPTPKTPERKTKTQTKKTGPDLNPVELTKQDKEEVKTRRVQIVLRPSTYKAGKARAKALGLSLNEYITRLIESESGAK